MKTHSHCLGEKRISEKNVHVPQLEPKIQVFVLQENSLLLLY
jgi:hypothetical protein